VSYADVKYKSIGIGGMADPEPPYAQDDTIKAVRRLHAFPQHFVLRLPGESGPQETSDIVRLSNHLNDSQIAIQKLKRLKKLTEGKIL
jgi:hypothetical protein